MSLADTQALVDDLVRDKDSVIASATRDTAIDNAVSRYSADAPRVLVIDATSDGSQYLNVPAGWIDGQSSLRSVEYPIGNIPTTLIDPAAVSLYTSPGGPQFQLFFTPIVDDALRLSFTAPHTLDDSTDTIPAQHQRALACLAAADICGQLSAYYATEGAPTIGADVADHLGKTERYRNRARDLLAEYTSTVGAAPSDRTKPASATAQPVRDNSLGRPRLFHPPRGWPQ